MARTNDIQAYNLVLTNQLNGVQAPAPEITTGDKMQAMGSEFLVGTAGIVALPLAGNLFKTPWQSFKGMGKDGKSYLDVWRELSEQSRAQKAALKGDNIWQSYLNRRMYGQIQGIGAEIPTFDSNTDLSKLKPKQLLKYQNTVTKSAYYSDAKRILEETKQMLENAKRNGTTVPKATLKAQLNKLREAVRLGDAKVNSAMQSGVLKPTSWFGKAKHQIKLKTGGYKINNALLKTTRGASALKCASKCVKGAGWMAVIQGLCEIPDIISAYQIDKAEKAAGRESNRGNKQLLKSGVKVGTSILGYAAGAAAAGAIAGTVVPGIGNVAGAVVGFVGGLIGGFVASWAAGKAMDAATGEKDSLNKSEADLYAEEQNQIAAKEAEEAANLAAMSGEYQDQILAAAEQMIEQGDASEDVLEAYDYLINHRESRILDLLQNIQNMDYAA